MRYAQLFGRTVKEVPRGATVVSHQLLLQGGFISQVAAGIYSFLPLGFRVLEKIDRIIKEEFSARGVQHLLMPFVHPSTLWEESGRRQKMAEILATFQARHGGEYLLAPTHEETVTDLARRFIRSYRDLPVIVNQNQWKYRDEIRVTGGLLRTREFLMQDAYSFDRDAMGLDRSFTIMSEAYRAVFDRMGLPTVVVQADSGTMGGTDSEEFMVMAEAGEDSVLVCGGCDYRANIDKAVSRFAIHPQDKERKPMKAVKGEGLIGVEPLATFLGLPVHQTTKTLLFQADDRVVAVMVRGDYDVSEVKLKNYLKCDTLHLATSETVKKLTGADVGYAGPVGLPSSVAVIADLTCKDRVNFEAGANRTDHHNINVNFDRDFPTPPFVDLRAAKAGDGCPKCERGKLQEQRAIELGHVFKLGTCYAESMGASFVDEDGRTKPLVMGCYGIGISRVMAAAVEVSHDGKGIVWPEAIAPYRVHLLTLGKEEEVMTEAGTLYEALGKQGIEVLYDDREAGAGDKLADADLIGIPHRVIVSAKSLKGGGVEWKRRAEKEGKVVKAEELSKLIS